jgi:glycosyltransferase involved in cell wall biosynthesis
MPKLPLSVCIISGAEVHRIGRALASVSGWASEVLVVLNEDVHDGTEESCLKNGAKVFREPWKGYVAQKNSVIEKASFPWILSLDADEEVTQNLREEIATALGNPALSDTYCAFEFPRCSYYCGRWIRHGDWYPDRVVRLWRKGSALYSGGQIHERLEVNGSVGRLRSDLLHFSNESINWQLGKIPHYSDLFVRDSVAKGRKPTWLDLTFRPIWKFLRGYVLRLGFLDGWPGYYIAWVGAFSTLTRYTKVLEAQFKRPGDLVVSEARLKQ